MTRALALLILLVALAASPSAAHGASYVVRSCSNGSPAGWAAQPPWRASDTCRAGGGGALSARVDGGPNEQAAWTFTAPPDTDIEAFAFTRSYWLAGGVAFGTPVFRVVTAGPGRAYVRNDPNYSPFARSTAAGTERAGGLTEQQTLEVAVFCGGGWSCVTPAASLSVTSASIALHDAYAPVVERVSGTLLADGPVAGTGTVRYTAADRGGGVARAELRLDGTLVADGPADLNGGACVPVRGEYATPQPCRARATNTLTADTRDVPDGRHTLSLRVLDATGVNHGEWSTRIDVDNVPPPANRTPPTVSGRAVEGSTLTASAGTWDGTDPTFAYRWQRDDGGWADIAGAGSATYLAQSADVGHRLRARVMATDAEGSGVAYSAPTARVAAAPVDDGEAQPGGGDPAGGGSPSPGGGSTGGGSPGGGSPGGGAATSPGSADLVVRARLATTAGSIPYGRTARVRGAVVDASGAPASGVRVTLLSAVDGEWRVAGEGLTRADGGFTLLAGPGPSRWLAVTAGAARSPSLRLAVRAPVRLQVVRTGGHALLRGALAGGHVPRGGVLVRIQRRRPARWVTVATRLTDARGRFGGRIALPAGALRARIRATVPRQPGYPFAAGASQPE